ncbi:hypothetical protein CLG85_011120 [Yangia mangrovi]|uniref:Uncharacterized protein n=1 Tax=Alloyangia mangrovi TaxID=1779329 RepID=A0ABT2KKG8_9RHOB|nr:hypothetical protein [Alloyangia mangrovi]MCT4370838.1 hypothetical protein [Alloyangia mangrovi]
MDSVLFGEIGKDLVQPRNDFRARRDHALNDTHAPVSASYFIVGDATGSS